MLRIEAGLPLIGVEFSSSRYAYNDHDRFTPDELGLRVAAQGHRRRRHDRSSAGDAILRRARDRHLAVEDRRARGRLARLRRSSSSTPD